MATAPSNTTNKKQLTTKPPGNNQTPKDSLGVTSTTIHQICITIDHLEVVDSKDVAYPVNAYTYASQLVNAGIPVTVFIWPTGGNAKPKPQESIILQKLADLNKGKNPPLVTLGVHTLDHNASVTQQDANTDEQIKLIVSLQGTPPAVASYHGEVYSPLVGNYSTKGIKYIRGTFPLGAIPPNGEPLIFNSKMTPVYSNTPDGIRRLNSSSKPCVFFFHPNQIYNEANVKNTFNALVAGVKAGRFIALSYLNAAPKSY
jgi:hypothetical protein